MKILVTGGAGYIGSFMVKRLLDDGNDVVVADSLECGHESVLDNRAAFVKGSLLDKNYLKNLFTDHQFDGVIHFAGYISVAESTIKPELYFTNNFLATLNLLEQMVESHVLNIIFSSTAAVYGTPQHVPIPENHPKKPESPYGDSKLMVETLLHWYHTAHTINSVALRYFNASGAMLDGSMGEMHDPETHIIPNAIKAVIEGKQFTLFGTDYPTKDGTAVRDYIHVLDLAEAHILALRKISKDGGEYTFNVGTGMGYSNQEVINMVEKVSKKKIEIHVESRRSGDPVELVADVDKIKKELGFKPLHSELETIVESAWKWHSKQDNHA
jgi:UDP-glucose 4-epimerase